MNDKALEHAYKLFVEDGYTHGPEDFKKLIESNPAALNHSYELFKGDGYIHGIDDFKLLDILRDQIDTKISGFFDKSIGSSTCGLEITSIYNLKTDKLYVDIKIHNDDNNLYNLSIPNSEFDFIQKLVAEKTLIFIDTSKK